MSKEILRPWVGLTDDSAWLQWHLQFFSNAHPLGEEHMKDEDDDTQGFMPDWANFQEGRAVGWTEAIERIAEKVKSMPWENDTRDSFLIWLKEQK
jgi:hypothetical protein